MSIYADIEKNYGDFRLTVQFEAEKETLALFGASGCGKSLTLKCIAGIERPDRGRIELDGRVLFDSEKHINLSPQERRTGLMFQNYALFPNMTVRQNILAGARRSTAKQLLAQRAGEMMKKFGLSELSGHYPAELSGGQQQRTALARILISDPDILLLDEPFSALDSHLRFRLEEELARVIKEFGKTVILVSHDRNEVYGLADRIAIMHSGHIEELGTTQKIFTSPMTRNAALLTGRRNISPVIKIGEHSLSASDWNLIFHTVKDTGNAAYACIAPSDIVHSNETDGIRCRVNGVIEEPSSFMVLLDTSQGKEPLLWQLPKDDWHRIRSDTVYIELPEEKVILLER